MSICPRYGTHKYKPLKRGFPQKVCMCGSFRATELIVGRNTITLSPAGVGDVIRWSASQASVAAGDIGMDATSGRIKNFVEGEDRALGFQDEAQGGGTRRMWGIQQDAGLTTLSNIGFATAPTANGTASVVDVSTGEGQFIQYLSAAVINSDAGLIASSFTQTQFVYRFIADHAFRSPATITNGRWWVGVFSGSPMASATPALSYAAFRRDTSAGDVNWQAVTDNGSGVPTITNTTVAFTGTTSYRLRIEVDSAGANIRFYINGILRATHTTTLPVATTTLGMVHQVRTLDAVAKGVRFGRFDLAQRAA